ncbi:MAG: S46 family peptidase [Bacteroidales bacterium]|nr:S46 family peptidase [Bacteroidales bacterium]
MKKLLITLAAMLAIAGTTARADEGMWLLPLLEKLNSGDLSKAGCRLSPEQIYSINHSSLKDAVVHFGAGCTGEMISGEGLLVTNHHCGYSSIQKLSSVEHDYLKDGFWAMSRADELPCEGLSVTFLKYMEDVTEEINEGKSTVEDIRKRAEEKNPGCRIQVLPFYSENVWYLLVSKVYDDVRFVGAPPSSIGKFGADTDNWMWPRHTCDFSMFRVYCAPDGSPAAYSAENVPLKPERSLKISIRGVNEGDFTMIMGYPGRTTRFQTSPELESQIALNDIKISARTVRQNVIMEDMLADPKVKIQYASKYASSSNYWKKWQGMKLAFGRLGIIDRAKQEEKDFTAWVAADAGRQSKYGEALGMIASGVRGGQKSSETIARLTESIGRIEIVNTAISCTNFMKAFGNGEKAQAAGRASVKAVWPDYNVSTDVKVAKAMLKWYRENAPKSEYLEIPGEDFATMDIDSYVDRLFSGSVFASEEKLAAADYERIMNDPALTLAKAYSRVYRDNMPGKDNDDDKNLSKGRHDYTAALLEWKKDETPYPDANSTMRLTWGHVMGYSPRDAVSYRYYTTLEGVMEKEDPDNWEFVVPEKLKELYKAKDYGRYALKSGELPTCFLSNNDITGGNSGSPVLNARGELIGLAFDGNWESMSSDVMFEPELQRCINVDIRYVLFIIDKFGGAGHLIREMNIVK